MHVGLAPRRVLVALIIATCGLSAAVATDMIGDVDGLPEAFVPARPVVGESLEYQFVRLDREGAVAAGPLPAFQQVSLGNQWTLDTQGEPVLVHVVQRRQGTYVAEGTEQVVYDPKDDRTRMPWAWGESVAEATDGEGQLVWYSGATDQVTVHDTALGVVSTQQRRDESASHTTFGDRNGRLLSSCLAAPLPDHVPLDRSVGLGTDGTRRHLCRLDTPWLDDRHPGHTTGKALHEKDVGSQGVLLEPRVEAVGSVQTDFGEGVMFRYAPPHDTTWEIRLVYVPEVPYPVWVTVSEEGSPTRDVFFLGSYEKPEKQPVPPAQAKAPAPALEWTTPRPWGMDDAGMDLPILPSEAWAAALEPQADGTASPLAEFLARHDGAFTERAAAAVVYVEDDSPNSQQRFRWEFQVRGGDERLALRVQQGPHLRDLQDVPLGPLEVEYVGSVEPRWILEDAPARVPTMRSTAAQFDHWTGLGQPAHWLLEPGCNKRVAVECGQDLMGPAIAAGVAKDHQEPSLDPEALALRMDYWNTGSRMSWLVDGRVKSMSTHTTAMQITTDPVPSGDADPPAVTAIAPATDYTRATGYSLGAAALLVALLYYLWPALKAVPAPLFSRVNGAQVLEHPARAQLARAIEQEPGIHHQELVRLLGSGGTVDHHLQKLMAGGVIVRAASAGYTCYFPKHTDRRIMAAAPALRSPASRRVLASTLEEPVRAADVARAAGIARSSAAHHLSRLIGAQVVERCGSGRSVLYRATALGRQMAKD